MLSQFDLKRGGLEGICQVATFDEVLYFARSEIPEDDYQFGRQSVGFPLASWAVLSSKDRQLLFLRKKGSEGAYEGSPYSAFGSLVSADKDVAPGHNFKHGMDPISSAMLSEYISSKKLLERSVGGEVGSAVWERVAETRQLGFNVYDQNSSKVNNGYDVVWKVDVDASMAQIISLLETNPQFEPGSHVGVIASPTKLGEFIGENRTTVSGLSGILCYVGSHFGEDEVKAQYDNYRTVKGSEAVDLEIREIR